MADLLRQGSAWLEQMRTSHCSSPVEYRRPPQTLIVNATFGRTGRDARGGTGPVIGAHAWDFLILADELGLEPRAGDVIVAEGRRYEVMDLDEEGCWRWSDPYRQTYRIHTKDIGADS